MNRIILALVAVGWTCGSIAAQEVQPQVTIVKLATPTYPPMALAARVWGEVSLDVTLAPDGTAKTVAVQSGPPMLRQTVVDSATQSQYQANVENSTGTYRVVYDFVLDQTTKCEHDDSYPRVKHEANTVTITEQNVPLCDPSAVIETIRFRSAKCIYLWKCGSKTP